MIHLGDITKINGAEAPEVNVIIGGSPCQDLSVAGQRKGLKGERSGLFMEQIRIIKEMRKEDINRGCRTTDIRPRYMVWENVPGAFSSNKGQDFKAVLEETIGVVEKIKPDIPIPEGGWHYSGAIMGNGFSIAWRVFDAQFWGVPQRRRRIALVADFGGQSAPEILFERKSLSGDITQSGTPWKEFARIVAQCFNSADRAELRAETHGHTPAVYDYDRRHDKCQGVEVAPTVTAKYGTGGGNTPLVYDARGNGEGGTVPTITGDHQNRVTDYTALAVGFQLGFRPENVRTYDETATTLCNGTRAGFCNGLIALDRASFNQGVNAQYDPKISEDGINSTLTAQGPSALCVEECAGFKSLNGAKARSIAYERNLSPTLAANKSDASVVNKSTVRRLTPLECERLQGFPDGWTDIGEYIDTSGKKRKTSDSARYKALGNSIALPSWVWVLERISNYCGTDKTMASLFDGIGGFPLIWETLNGKGTCLWASEIEEFPIAVTKYHFNKGE